MKKGRVAYLLISVLLLTQSASAQNLFGPGTNAKGKKETPIFKEVSGLEVIKTVYPDAVAVEKVNTVWFKIVDNAKKTIGYTLSSKPYSEGIIGYHNTTPVIIVTDNYKVIKKVALLSNWEFAAYVKKLERQNFFNAWNGLKVPDAVSKRAAVDCYSGATYTASAITKNVENVLKAACENKIK